MRTDHQRLPHCTPHPVQSVLPARMQCGDASSTATGGHARWPVKRVRPTLPDAATPAPIADRGPTHRRRGRSATAMHATHSGASLTPRSLSRRHTGWHPMHQQKALSAIGEGSRVRHLNGLNSNQSNTTTEPSPACHSLCRMYKAKLNPPLRSAPAGPDHAVRRGRNAGTFASYSAYAAP